MFINPDIEQEYFLIKNFAKQLGIKVNFRPIKGAAGYFDCNTRHISISTYYQGYGDSPLGTFFHELGHWHAKKHGKFKMFHRGMPRNKKEWLQFCAQAVRAERWVDKWGQHLFYEIFPDGHYLRRYESKEDLDFLKRHCDYIAMQMRHPPRRKSDEKRQLRKNRKARNHS